MTYYFLNEDICGLNWVSITLRLVMALIIGGAIGLERGVNRHPAGFRTHILVCVGAALAMLTNQFIVETWAGATDPARLGAQVITGVGFLGVGTILITGKNRIKGLTTAAGLWASACLGLAVGIGFYKGAVIGAIVIFISLALLPKIERFFLRYSDVLVIQIEMSSYGYYKDFLDRLNEFGIVILEMGEREPNPVVAGGILFNVAIRVPKKTGKESLIYSINSIEGVEVVIEL